MTRQDLLIPLVLLAGCGPIGGPVVTEPMPDIPETVEYDTVRIEYGDDDLLTASARALVGSPSLLALVSQQFVRGTNGILRAQLALIAAVTRTRPTDYDDGVWSWDNAASRRAPELFSRFEIQEVEPGAYTYRWRLGETESDLLEVFSGEFHPRQRFNGRQRGLGMLQFNFSNLRQLDPDADPSAGRVAIAFRSVGGIRQVKVASFDLVTEEQPAPRNGQYEYVEFADGAGRFQFGAETDFLNDGVPLEKLSIDAVWTESAAGRALASLTGGSLMVNEVLLHECWDGGARTTFADATPDLAIPYEDGESSACDGRLFDIELEPPDVVVPQTDPAIPAAHPDEAEEIIVDP